MYLLGRTQMVSHMPYEEALGFFMDSGFDGAEISFLRKDFTLRQEALAPDFGRQILRAMEELNCSMCSVSAHGDYIHSSECFDTVLRGIDLACEIHAPCVVINGALRNPDEPRQKQWDDMVHFTRKLCDRAEERRMRLALEFEPNFVFGNTAEVLRGMGEIASPMLGMNADIGHMFLEDPDPVAAIHSARGKIFHAHVENMGRGVHNHLLPWEGDMDLPAFIQALRESGFDSCAALDLYNYDYAAVAPACAAYLKGLF